MNSHHSRDLPQVAIDAPPVVSERLLMFVLGLSAIVIVVSFIAFLSSYRPVPTRVASKILPVTELVTVVEPAPAPLEIIKVALTVTAPSVPVDDMIEHTVRQGQTLIGILRDYCRDDYVAVARANNIDPHWIYANKTVLKFKNGCTHAPSVLVNRNVSPRELASDGGASSGKHIPSLVTRAPEAKPLSPLAASAPAPSASQPIRAAALAAVNEAQPLSELRHREIYRIVALRNVKLEDRTRAENAELTRLIALIRQEVLARYKLPNPDCLYVKNAGKNWEEQTLFRVNCIRENYGAVIDEVAAEHQLESSYIEAIIIAESGGQPDAISPTGCTGLKQFCLGSSRLFRLRDRFDPFESIRAGGRHIEDNLRMWRGNVAKATAHWNAGSVMVGEAGFNAVKFPFTRNVLRIQGLIEKESRRLASGPPALVTVAYTSAR